MEPDGYLADNWLDIKHDLKTQSQSGCIEAWTDGSFKRSALGAPMSWAAFFPAIDRHISGKVEGQASSTLPEATAILVVLEIVPQNSSILIYTDSQACHTKMSDISARHSIHWPWHNLWNIWNAIDNTIRHKHLKFETYKVKAHSNLPYNDMANKLAKEAAIGNSCIIIAANTKTSEVGFCLAHDSHIVQSNP